MKITTTILGLLAVSILSADRITLLPAKSADWNHGTAPFGNGEAGWSYNTYWEPSTTLRLRHKINIPANTTSITAYVGVDNEYKFYVNGKYVAGQGGHGYGRTWEYSATIPPDFFIRGATNEIQVDAIDWGGGTFFDMYIVAESDGPPEIQLSAPENIRVSNDLNDRVRVEWDAVVGATAYDVFFVRRLIDLDPRSGEGADRVFQTNATTYEHVGVFDDITGYYAVRAKNSDSTSALSIAPHVGTTDDFWDETKDEIELFIKLAICAKTGLLCDDALTDIILASIEENSPPIDSEDAPAFIVGTESPVDILLTIPGGAVISKENARDYGMIYLEITYENDTRDFIISFCDLPVGYNVSFLPEIGSEGKVFTGYVASHKTTQILFENQVISEELDYSDDYFHAPTRESWGVIRSSDGNLFLDVRTAPGINFTVQSSTDLQQFDPLGPLREGDGTVHSLPLVDLTQSGSTFFKLSFE